MSLSSGPKHEQLDQLGSHLQSRGWFESRTLVPQQICRDLLSQLELNRTLGLFKKSGIGQGEQKQVLSEVRGDHIQWIETKTPTELEKPFIDWLESLKESLNSRLFLGLSGEELHYAVYPPGTGYQKHLDVFSKDSRRTLSFVLYLNPDWKMGDGGELSLFSESNPEDLELQIQPVFSQCVIFLSDKIHHQVEFTNKERFSVTGWLKKAAPTAVLPVF